MEVSSLRKVYERSYNYFSGKVYADWSQRELPNYYFAANHSTDSDENEAKLVVYSSSNRMLVKFPAWNMAERGKEFSWSILKVTRLAKSE